MPQHQEFIEKVKKIYKSLGSVTWPGLNGERVFFMDDGFRHLIKKNRKFRKFKDIYRRLRIVKYCKEIIESSRSYKDYKIVIGRMVTFKYWSLEGKVRELKIAMIIRQINNGRKHFFSVF